MFDPQKDRTNRNKERRWFRGTRLGTHEDDFVEFLGEITYCSLQAIMLAVVLLLITARIPITKTIDPLLCDEPLWESFHERALRINSTADYQNRLVYFTQSDLHWFIDFGGVVTQQGAKHEDYLYYMLNITRMEKIFDLMKACGKFDDNLKPIPPERVQYKQHSIEYVKSKPEF